MRKNILFDLDGTITDSAEGIMNSCRYALRKMGFPVADEKNLLRVVGPPLAFSFMNYFNMNERQAEQAISYYREYYVDKGIYENKLFEGVLEAFEKLSDYDLFIATSKPEKFAKMIVKHFKIDHFFQDVCGASLAGKIKEKEQVINKVIQRNALVTDETVMVGDRIHDFSGAKVHQIYSVGVTYGYGTDAELKEADAIIHSLQDLSGAIS